jgi:hypothetical protein
MPLITDDVNLHYAQKNHLQQYGKQLLDRDNITSIIFLINLKLFREENKCREIIHRRKSKILGSDIKDALEAEF